MAPRTLLLAILLLLIAGCGDTNAFHYDYQGTLLEADGRPAAGVKIYVRESVAPERSDEDRWEFWTWWGTTTDQQGRFQGIFNNARGETYYKWLSLVPIPPPAKRLDAVCVMANRHCEWIPILVPLNTASQKRGYEGGRHLDLPPATLVAAPQHGP